MASDKRPHPEDRDERDVERSAAHDDGRLDVPEVRFGRQRRRGAGAGARARLTSATRQLTTAPLLRP
jgi:hypothetical protein